MTDRKESINVKEKGLGERAGGEGRTGKKLREEDFSAYGLRGEGGKGGGGL